MIKLPKCESTRTMLLFELAQFDVDVNGESKQIISPTANIFLVGKLLADLPTANLM